MAPRSIGRPAASLFPSPRLLLSALAFLFLTAARGEAQFPDWRGYYLNVGIAMDSSAYGAGMVADAQRLRLMTTPQWGPARLDLAYEHLLELSSALRSSGAFGPLVPAGGGEWLPLQGTLTDRDRLSWRHQLDRASVSVGGERAELIIGRQPISWATTLFLTPTDPFAPFDPSDPFREFRKGVDAVRLRIFPGPLTEVEGVVRIAEYGEERTTTAVGRVRTAVGSWELGAWAGAVHDDPAAAVGATVTVHGAVVRGEGGWRRAEGRTAARLAVGVDRSFQLLERTLYLVLEVQHDGLGASSSKELAAVLFSGVAQHGELQVLGRDEAALNVSFQLHPLVSLDMIAMANLHDPSGLLSPALSFSATSEVSLRAGAYLGMGDSGTPGGLPESEFGGVPSVVYASASWFF